MTALLGRTFTPEQIAGATGCPLGNVRTYWPFIQQALTAQGLADTATVIAAVATVAVETPFAPVHEVGDATSFARYDGGNGNDRPGDGARYHGRGFVQLTGRANYRACGQKLGVALEDDPDLALDPKTAARILAQYIKDHRIDALAAQGDWKGARRAVNGGLNGWDRFNSCVQALLQLVPAGDDTAAPPAPAPPPATTWPAYPGEAVVGDGTGDRVGEQPKIKVWQDILIRAQVLMDNDGNRDGVYGPKTAARVFGLQQSWGWANADGKAGPGTYARITGTRPI